MDLREGIRKLANLQISKSPTISLKWIYPWKLCRNLLLNMDPSEQRVFIYLEYLMPKANQVNSFPSWSYIGNLWEIFLVRPYIPLSKQGTGGRCLTFPTPRILINPVFFKSVKHLHEKQCLTPKPRWRTEQRLKNITMGNKREAKEKRKQTHRPRGERKADNEECLTFLTRSKLNLKSQGGRPLGGRKELLDKPNWRQNHLQLGSPGERRGCVLSPTSPLLFPPVSFSWVLFLRFLLLLNSFHWKAALSSPLSSNAASTIPLRPCSPAAWADTGSQPADSDGWLPQRHTMADPGVSSACAAGLGKKEPEPTSDLGEADLIKVTAKGRAACGLHSPLSARDKARKYFSRRKSQES